jgi:hypothetical protein
MADDGGGGGGGSGTVKVPGLGPMKKVYVYAGLALVAGIVGYAYWTKSKGGGDVVYVDPAELSYGPALDTTTTPTTAGLSYNNTEDDDPTYGAPRTNREWADRAVSRMEWLNYDGQLVAVAIGKYLARQQLSTAEVEIIRTIQGLIGRPPEGDYPILQGPGTPTPSDPTPVTATYAAGNHVLVWINQQNDAHSGLGLTISRLKSLNPAIVIGQANERGFISPSNPAKPGQNIVDVFMSAGTARIQ